MLIVIIKLLFIVLVIMAAFLVAWSGSLWPVVTLSAERTNPFDRNRKMIKRTKKPPLSARKVSASSAMGRYVTTRIHRASVSAPLSRSVTRSATISRARRAL